MYDGVTTDYKKGFAYRFIAFFSLTFYYFALFLFISRVLGI